MRAYSRDASAVLPYAEIGIGDRYVGVNWLEGWYGRNLRIYGNLARIAVREDRILLIYGAGDAWLLRQFIEESEHFELVNPLQYLR